MICINHLFLLLSIRLLRSLSVQLPSDIRKCHFVNKDCLISSVNNAIRRYPKGIPEIGLKPLDAIKIDDAKILDPQQTGVFWMYFELQNATDYGYENTTITQIIGFDKDVEKSRMEIHGQIPRLMTRGNYHEVIKCFFIYINSTGEAISEFQNFRFRIVLKPSIEYRNQTRFLRITKVLTDVEIDRWIFNLNSADHINTDLVFLTNKFLNENWVVYWNELEPTILEMISKRIMDLLTPIFDKMPYDDLFL